MSAYDRFLAKAPAIYNAYGPLYEAILASGALSARTKTLAYLAASYVNESPYCVTRFHAIALQAGFTEEEVRAVQTEQDHVFSGMDLLVILAARELSGTCTLDDLAEESLAQLSPEQMVELAAVISLANFDNRFANALRMEPDKQSVHMTH